MTIQNGFSTVRRLNTWRTYLFILSITITVIVLLKVEKRSPTPSLHFKAVGPIELDSEAFKTTVTSIFQSKTGFSGSVLIAQGTKVIYDSGFGLATITPKQPHTLDTKYLVGSITKQFIAAGVLKLVETKKLTLADSLCKHVSSLCFRPIGAVTIHELLSHTGGLPDISCSKTQELLFRVNQWVSLSSTDPVRLAYNCELKSRGQFRYSNLDYILLGKLIEVVQQEPLDTYLKREIFLPLHMERTSLALANQSDDLMSISVTPQSQNESLANTEWSQQIGTSIYRYNILQGAGGGISTPNDLLKWSVALDNDSLLSEPERTAMFTPYKAHYGYAWVIEEWKKHGPIVYWHNGQVLGYYSIVYKIPSRRITIIVNINREREAIYDRMIRALVNAALGMSFEVPNFTQ